MRLQTLCILALSCALVPFAAAQTGSTPAQTGTTSSKSLGHLPKPGQTTELPATAASVKSTDAVITLNGACKSGTESGCVTSVSREQFEQMANSIKPGMTTIARRNFAIQYARVLAFSDEARALGLENDPRFQDILKFVKDQLLVEALNQHYSDQYSNPSDQKIEEYYKENSKKFLQADLQRVIIPSQPAAAEIKKPSEADEKAYVDKVREQWVAGADPATLQKEALSRMGLNGSVPDINLKNHTPGMLPENQQSVFEMKPGEISQPFVDAGAAYIYKMVSETEKPLSEVKTLIAKTLHDDAMRQKIQELSESVKPSLNEAYFGPEKGPEVPEQGAMAPAQQSGSAEKTNTAPTAPPKK
jgi:PPIC-type PPIASE domain